MKIFKYISMMFMLSGSIILNIILFSIPHAFYYFLTILLLTIIMIIMLILEILQDHIYSYYHN